MTIVRIYTPGVQTLCVESSLVDNTVLVYVGKTLCASQLSISYIPHALVHFSTFLSLSYVKSGRTRAAFWPFYSYMQARDACK